MNKIKRIVFCGTPKIGMRSLEALYENKNYEIIFVVSQPDRLIGRKKEIIFSPVKDFCIKNNIKLYQPTKIIEIKDIFFEAKPDLVLTCAFGQFIPTSILDIPKYKCVNVHASLLPKYRGGAPIHWAIINGEKETGITLMYMEKEMDSGNIIYQESFIIEDDDNLKTVFNKMEELAYKIVKTKIDTLFDSKLKSIPQDKDKITFGYNIKREDERINWKTSAVKINNLVRGLYPNPSSFTTLNGIFIKILKSKILKTQATFKEPGEIILVDKHGITISTSDFDLLITSIQFEGKKIISDNEIYNYREKLNNNFFI